MKINKRLQNDIKKQAKLYRQMMLARPKACRLKPWPDPELERKLPAPVPRACLNPKVSPEILKLYNARKSIVPKFFRPLPPEHYVKPSAMLYVASNRMRNLAYPKQLPPPLPPPPRTKKQENWDQHLKTNLDEWIQIRSQPKKIPPSPELPLKKKRLPLSQLIERLKILSTPAKHHQWQRPKPPPFRLREEPPLSDRVVFLAQPRKVPSEALLNLNYDPYKIEYNTLHAKVTDATKRLAEPRKRVKAVDDDFKENAFTVSPLAMKYKPTARIKELAKPRLRQ